MENLEIEASMEKYRKLDRGFNLWLQEVESICHKAVFAQNEGLMDAIIPELVSDLRNCLMVCSVREKRSVKFVRWSVSGRKTELYRRNC